MPDSGLTWSDVATITLPIVTAAVISVIWIQAQINSVRGDLAAYKEMVAKEYVTQQTLEKVEGRIVDAINRLGDRFDNVIAHRAN